mmetsp:Transcript_24217/g.21323  ORF Transcript_24217/g.21323 Transcript_24217/m.21323 type:complete len:100 (+) Transcript_24217:311-610(+)
MKDTNHMHNVPVHPGGYNWCIEFERRAVFKTPCKGWTYSNDPVSKRHLTFRSLEQAIHFAKENGLGFEVEYPKFRYHTRKNYGDNYKWKGHPKPEYEDI